MNTVAIGLPKGGVGKTTVSINLADRLAARGHDVLLVDLDQQGGSTEGLGQEALYTADEHVGDVLRGDVAPGRLIQPRTETIPFDLIASHRDLNRTAMAIGEGETIAASIERKLLDPLDGRYDWVLFDSPPTIGPLSNATFRAGRRIVVPVLMSEPSLRSLSKLVTQQLVPINADVDVEIVAIVPNRLSGDNEERRVLSAIENSEYGSVLPHFARTARIEEDGPGPGIRERIAIRRATREAIPLGSYDPESDMLERFDALAAIVERRGVRRRRVTG